MAKSWTSTKYPRYLYNTGTFISNIYTEHWVSMSVISQQSHGTKSQQKFHAMRNIYIYTVQSRMRTVITDHTQIALFKTQSLHQLILSKSASNVIGIENLRTSTLPLCQYQSGMLDLYSFTGISRERTLRNYKKIEVNFWMGPVSALSSKCFALL